jgi:6-pyruvoyltetrahydropterin/6-carboxytetrahydropterin synthase
MYTITKEFHFSASHQLNGLKEGHQCSRVHGHNYIVKIELRGNTLQKEAQFLQDYGDLKSIKDWIEDNLEHRHLNDLLPGNPTAENIAFWVYHRWKKEFPLLSAVEVSETPKTNARYEIKT